MAKKDASTPEETKSTAESTFVAPRITRGRIVDYHHQDGNSLIDLSAIVTNVACIRPDTMVVCLTVFDSLGSTFGVQGITEGEGAEQWSWPARG